MKFKKGFMNFFSEILHFCLKFKKKFYEFLLWNFFLEFRKSFINFFSEIFNLSLKFNQKCHTFFPRCRWRWPQTCTTRLTTTPTSLPCPPRAGVRRRCCRKSTSTATTVSAFLFSTNETISEMKQCFTNENYNNF